MASVRLNFVQPEQEGLTRLLIFESTTQTGTYSLIETVEDIGEYPNYISIYTTDLANNSNDWFAIQWEDDKGAKSPLSNPIQGNTTTAPGVLTSRVILRDPALDEAIALQEAEVTLSSYFETNDIYALDPNEVTYAEWGGLTYLTLARSYITELLVGSTNTGYTAGIVAQQQGSATKSVADIQSLIAEANRLLGRNYSLVMQLAPWSVDSLSATDLDISRLLVEMQ